MKTIGYARVSTSHQKFDSQLKKLKEYGCTKIYQETESGTLNSRPVLEKTIKKLKKGDTFVVYRLDRLARGTRYLLELMDDFEKRGINFVSISDNLDTNTAMGRFFFTVMGAFSEMEASLIRERVKAGLYATKEKGTVLGRPPKEEERLQVLAMTANGLPVEDIIKIVPISRSTAYRYIKEAK